MHREASDRNILRFLSVIAITADVVNSVFQFFHKPLTVQRVGLYYSTKAGETG